MWRRGQLSNRILASVVAILVATTVVGLCARHTSRRTQLGTSTSVGRSRSPQTFAAMPSIREALYRHDAATGG